MWNRHIYPMTVGRVVVWGFTRRGDWVEWEHNKVVEALTLTFMCPLPPDTQHLGPHPSYPFLTHLSKSFCVAGRYVSHAYSILMTLSALFNFFLSMLCFVFHARYTLLLIFLSILSLSLPMKILPISISLFCLSPILPSL